MFAKKLGIKEEEDLLLYFKLNPKIKRLKQYIIPYKYRLYFRYKNELSMSVILSIIQEKNGFPSILYGRSFSLKEIAKILEWSCKRGFKNHGITGYIYEECIKELSFDFLINTVTPLIRLRSDEQSKRWAQILKMSLLFNKKE